MDINQQITLSSSPSDDDQHLNPEDSVHQSAPDDVSFGFNHLQIDANDHSNSQELIPESPETDVDDDEDDVEDGDFTFACVGDNDSPISFDNRQIRTVYPLFDRSLLSGGDYDDDDGKLRLLIGVPVNNVFVESPFQSPLHYGETAGTVQALSDKTGSGSPEINMKSNSTGFSKFWRFRNDMNRSNSDSRDAFVFLEMNRSKASAVAAAAAGRPTEKVNIAGGKRKAVKKPAASAHEVYLKQKGGPPEEERRRSYLPYRPGLMGFFTNVNGGLSKNVHPF